MGQAHEISKGLNLPIKGHPNQTIKDGALIEKVAVVADDFPFMKAKLLVKLRVGSLFAGVGGICMAFKNAGMKIAWANELDKNACKTYRHNFRKTKLIEEDINNLISPKGALNAIDPVRSKYYLGKKPFIFIILPLIYRQNLICAVFYKLK